MAWLLAFAFLVVGTLWETAAWAQGDAGSNAAASKLGRADFTLEIAQRSNATWAPLKPERKEKRKVKVKVRRWVVDHEEEVSEEQEVEILIDEWTYDLGPKRFVRFVSFENARVTRITTGQYGRRPKQ